MKLRLLLIALIVLPLHLSAQQVIKDSLSYAMAMQLAENLKQRNILNSIDLNAFKEGMEDVIGNKMRMTSEQCRQVISNFLTGEYERLKLKNLEKGSEFLEKVKIEEGVVALPSGLLYKIIDGGTGPKPTVNDDVEVHYKGTLVDGREFDSSYARNETAKFLLGRVIKGWSEGLQYIGEGGRIMLFVPPQLAYGENSPQGSIIEPNSVLIFNIELIKVYPKQQQEQGLIKPQPVPPPVN
ncbi:MAG: FKBP-type peptidyl-prolyl cis-trans isomerase [Prevotellaceae bacterium]|jgi:FKBP-type peptidyl-prolyl cis-trans isomerase|nr:FKBP-type peptidyl-prolyl cis-trans isomerase [Prevotellaceae bacterium]